MSDNGAGNGARYWAFISYSHKDAAFGRRLHRRLESYTLPRRLVGRATPQGTVPRKLAPIFRDREELPAANDLSAEVRAALAASRSLIVVCSPSSAASPWVGREIEAFRELHPDRPVLAAIRDGEPADCFPDALNRTGPDGAVLEPLAADFRKRQDGEQLGLLKLVAGIVGVGLDELVQRDALRRTRRVTAVTAGALAAMVIMGVLTVFAFTAQREAERQRGEAEGLVEYMLTDLRTELKGVGRLDVMSDVNKRALAYYDREIRSSSLSESSRAQRARIQLALGEDDENRGDLVAALHRFNDAAATTRELLANSPNDPKLIFDQGQSEYYLGSVDYYRDDAPRAREKFLNYRRLAQKLVSLDPNNGAYHQEVAYAESNLCSLAFKAPQDLDSALRHCSEALAQSEQAKLRLGPTREIEDSLIDHHGWLADVYRARGDLKRALEERLAQERLLSRLMDSKPSDMTLKESWVALQIALALLEKADGQQKQANDRLKSTLTLIDLMIAFEPRNKHWRDQKDWIDKELSKLN